LIQPETIYVPREVPQSRGEYIAQEVAATAVGGVAGAPIKGSKIIKNAIDSITATFTSKSLEAERESLQGEITIKLRDDGVYEVSVPEVHDGNATWATKISRYELKQDGRIFLKEEEFGDGKLAQHPQITTINKYVPGLDLRRLTNGGTDFLAGRITIQPDVRNAVDSLLKTNG